VLESRADAPVQPSQLRAIEVGRWAERVEPRPPERLVRVDVSHPRQGALVEEGGLERCAAGCEPLAEASGREERVQRLVADAFVEIRLCLAGFEQEPRAEAPDIPVSNVRSVV
jgi:hypothetical protein